jgi:hypothetical protein
MFKIFKKLLRNKSSDSFDIIDGTQIEYKSSRESWLVRWRSRHGDFSCDTKDEVEIFLSEEEARFFKLQLELAFKLLKYTNGTKVTMEKNV